MKEETLQKLIQEIQTKEGLISLILGVIKENPNNTELGKIIRKNFKDYLDDQ